MRFFKGFDYSLLLIVVIIGALSLTSLWSLAPKLFPQQLFFFLIGFVCFFLFAQIDFRLYQNFKWPFYLGSIFFLILTFALGEITRGSIRWLQVGPFTIQSSEIVKPFLLVFFAFLFSGVEIKYSKIFFPVILFLIPFFLIFKQPDLGSSLVLGAAFIGIITALNLPLSLILSAFGFLLVFLPSAWFFLAEYQKKRILTFLNPNLDPLGAGYNLIQAVITVGSGQFFGRGLDKGTQSHLAFLPEFHTDFVFASFVEELGFLGGMILLILYFLLLWRLLKIAQNSRRDYAKIFTLGVFSMILFQVFVNVGMNLGLVPITGITLPFFSYGGSSLLATMIFLGMVENINRLEKRQETIEIR